MNEDHICSRCNTRFANKSSLTRHVRSARYCSNLSIEKHDCAYCSYTTKLKHNLNIHLETCKFKEKISPYEDRIEELKELLAEQETKDEKIRSLEKTLEETRRKVEQLTEEVTNYKVKLAKEEGKTTVYKERPGTVYVNPKILNVKCDTIPPLTIDTVKQEVDSGNYTYEMYIRGERGLVDFIATLIKSDDDQRSYVCTDTARNKFHRLIETREWKEDNGANFLNKIFDQLKEPATLYYKKINSMSLEPEERDTGDFLMDKTKRMFFGITSAKSKDRVTLFNKIRGDVRSLASI